MSLSNVVKTVMLAGRLTIEYVQATGEAGTARQWHSISSDGDTITVRGRELRPFVAAWIKTIAGSLPAHLREPAREIIRALEGGAR
jgi:hypothetical protein